MSYHIGDQVRVNKHIYRVADEPGDVSVGDVADSLSPPDGFVDDGGRSVRLYARKGETGTIHKFFRNEKNYGRATGPVGPWYAQVSVGGHIKTFRITSLERV